MTFPIIMHVNYCEQGQTLDEICDKAVELGFDGVEFRGIRKGMKDTGEAYLDKLSRAVQRSGLREVLFRVDVNLADPRAEARAGELEQASAFLRMAAERFRLTLCNSTGGPLYDPNIPPRQFDRHGSAIARQEHWQWAADGYRALGDVAASLGIRLALEVHMGFIHDLPATARKLVDMIAHPAIGVNMDFGNVFYFPKHPSLQESIELAGDRLYYVHWKNGCRLASGETQKVGLGEGDINHREYLRLLNATGYCGPICVESPRQGDREWYAQQDAAYVKYLMRQQPV